MDIVYKGIDEITPYEDNPRNNEEAVKYVANSIKEFGFKVPVVVTTDGVIIAGHTRLKAAKSLGLKEVPCIVADDLNEAQAKAYRLADNKVGEFAEWDTDLLLKELDDIENMDFDIDMEDFGFVLDSLSTDYDGTGNSGSLLQDFIIPPFSVLNARDGAWQDRKRSWKRFGVDSGEGREESLLGEGLNRLAKASGQDMLTGTSIFDPVLCEIMYRWFNVDGGSVYDCFAGGSVRGIVAGFLGYQYTGIDLRPEQIKANQDNLSRLEVDDIKATPVWICDDSLNVDTYVEDNSVDMILSCPPYADLEKYSDDPRDISNMDYKGFIKVYTEIINKAVKKLKNDRFAVFVVGDVRDKKGVYRGFTDDTKRIFRDAGLVLYNEFILVEQIGTGAIRARRQFNGGRKVIKCLQNVLVFYKGDLKKIKENYTEVIKQDVDDMISEMQETPEE